jgi:hypothetical protein
MNANSSSEPKTPNPPQKLAAHTWAGIIAGTLTGTIFLGRQLYGDWDYWPAAHKFDWQSALLSLCGSIPLFACLSAPSAWQGAKRRHLLSGALIGAGMIALLCLAIICGSLLAFFGTAKVRGEQTFSSILQWFLHVYLPVGIVSGLMAAASRRYAKGRSQ